VVFCAEKLWEWKSTDWRPISVINVV